MAEVGKFNQSLLNNKLFLTVMILGVVGAVLTSLLIIDAENLNLELCYSSSCFATFLDIFSFPILILQATFAILAFVAILHRSSQTEAQIQLNNQQYEVSIEQNTYNNYYHHRVEFYEAITEQVKSFSHLKLANRAELYRIMFKENNPSHFKFTGSVDVLNIKIERLFIRLARTSEGLYDDKLDCKSSSLSLYEQINLLRNVSFTFVDILEECGVEVSYTNVSQIDDYKFPEDVLSEQAYKMLSLAPITYVNFNLFAKEFFKLLNLVHSLSLDDSVKVLKTHSIYDNELRRLKRYRGDKHTPRFYHFMEVLNRIHVVIEQYRRK